MANGNLFVISGPSGAGKGTLVARVLERVPNTWVSVSATTRKPRKGEKHGVHYYFLSDEEFDAIIEENGFLEWATVHTARYGTPLQSVLDHIDEGMQVLLEIDVQGGLQVKDKVPDAHLVFIEPPSMEELRERLIKRGTETIDVINARMKVAEVEMREKKKYDFVLMNDNLDEATDNLLEYIESFARNNEEE
ncbi:MAG: guanylate kinase [Eggerthellaceae bacterium]|nr:guanylate kinase [Eggerthellaceae bacterium]